MSWEDKAKNAGPVTKAFAEGMVENSFDEPATMPAPTTVIVDSTADEDEGADDDAESDRQVAGTPVVGMLALSRLWRKGRAD